MKQIELNIDSLVDVIANLVGILIIVVVMAIVLSAEGSNRVDSERGNFNKIEQDAAKSRDWLAKAHTRIEELKARLSELTRESAEEVRGLERAMDGRQQSLAAMRSVEKKQGVLASSLAGLGKKEEQALSLITLAEQKIAKAIAKAPPDVVARARRVELAPLRDGLASLTSERDTLVTEAQKLEKLDSTLAEKVKSFDAARAATEQEIKDLTDRSFVKMEVRDPLASIDRARKPVFVECYTPAKAVDADGTVRPCVRLFASQGKANYVSDGGELKPVAEGESILGILDTDSAYRKAIGAAAPVAAEAAEFKKGHYLYFVVRPDAYRAFLAARKLGWDAGWTGRWDPIGQGTTIPVRDFAPH